MALTTCPDCSNELSTLATTCPNCGRPADKGAGKKKDAAYNAGHAIELALYLGVLVFGFWVALKTEAPVLGWVFVVLGAIMFITRFKP
jgi:hypothetical protein